jgi:hypothetical protein
MNAWKCTAIGLLTLAGTALLPQRSFAQYPNYCYQQQPYVYSQQQRYYYPPVQQPQPRQLGPSTFAGSAYNFAPAPAPRTVQYFEPTYSSFYDPRQNAPRYVNPGPYWYTRSYPYSPSYYSFYDTPGYFRY